jgi:hypothetical protein
MVVVAFSDLFMPVEEQPAKLTTTRTRIENRKETF